MTNELPIEKNYPATHKLEKVYSYDEAFKTKALVLWNKATILLTKRELTKHNVAIIIKNKELYKKTESATKIPWWFIAILHGMESDFNIKTWLANGDPLGHDTVNVPKGLHCDGTWVDAAIISLQHDRFIGITDWSILHCLYLFEAWNGWGFAMHGVNSAYVWAGTTEQMPGRYTKDGPDGWDPKAVSARSGCAAMLKMLIELGLDSFDPAKSTEPKPAPIPSADVPNNPKGIIGIVVNTVDISDIRALDANGKTYWFERGITLEMLYLSALSFGCPRVKISAKAMDKRPVITTDNIPTYQVNK